MSEIASRVGDRLSPSSDNRHEREWLKDYLATYYYMPPLALWRALEARAIGDEGIPGPSIDIGAWDGSFAATWLGGRPALDVGLDLSPCPTPYTLRAYRKVVAADARQLPFDAGAFNGILCNSVIEHIPDDLAVVRECARVLRPGGVLILTTPSIYFHDFLDGVRAARLRHDEHAAQAYMRRVDTRLQHYRYRSVADWTAILDEASMAVVSHTYYLPQPVTTYWDRLDNRMNRQLFGRALWQLLKSPKLRRVVPPGFWSAALRPVVERAYREAIASEKRGDAPGASILLKAVRR